MLAASLPALHSMCTAGRSVGLGTPTGMATPPGALAPRPQVPFSGELHITSQRVCFVVDSEKGVDPVKLDISAVKSVSKEPAAGGERCGAGLWARRLFHSITGGQPAFGSDQERDGGWAGSGLAVPALWQAVCHGSDAGTWVGRTLKPYAGCVVGCCGWPAVVGDECPASMPEAISFLSWLPPADNALAQFPCSPVHGAAFAPGAPRCWRSPGAVQACRSGWCWR